MSLSFFMFQVVSVLSKHAGLWITRDKEIMYSQVLVMSHSVMSIVHVMSCHVMSCHVMSCHLVAQVQLAPAGECDGGRHRGAAAHTGAVTLYACRNQGSPCRFMFQLSQLQLAVSHGAAKQIRQLAGEEGLDLGLPLRGQVTCRRVAGVWQCS